MLNTFKIDFFAIWILHFKVFLLKNAKFRNFSLLEILKYNNNKPNMQILGTDPNSSTSAVHVFTIMFTSPSYTYRNKFREEAR